MTSLVVILKNALHPCFHCLQLFLLRLIAILKTERFTSESPDYMAKHDLKLLKALAKRARKT